MYQEYKYKTLTRSCQGDCIKDIMAAVIKPPSNRKDIVVILSK